MSGNFISIIRAHCGPLEPIATHQAAHLEQLDAIRAVLFDVYGTLLISASGDVGTTDGTNRAGAFHQALAELGLDLLGDPQRAADCLFESIHAAHACARANGNEYPEVDIVEVWQATIDRLIDRGMLAASASQTDMSSLALQYEVRTNPTWPMPGLQRCLNYLHNQHILLGIVSNAQFFTPLLFPALVGRTLEQLGVDASLQCYSYRLGSAKPGKALYQLAADALFQREMQPHEVLFLGNDLLNDVMPAAQVGFRTALFAGDARSLRLRRGDSRIDGIAPDLTVTDLTQLETCIGGQSRAARGQFEDG